MRAHSHPESRRSPRTLIVFDLDGTLIDSRQDLAESANAMLATFGAHSLGIDQVAGMVGDGARVLVERVLAGAGLTVDPTEALDRFVAIYEERLLIHTRLYPGILDAVVALASSSSLAVLTNKPERPARVLLDAFGLAPYFNRVIGGDSGFPRKPDPAALLDIVGAAQVARSATLFVGDSMVDVETARRAGVPVCVALYGYGRSRGDLVLSGTELLAGSPDQVGPLARDFLGTRP